MIYKPTRKMARDWINHQKKKGTKNLYKLKDLGKFSRGPARWAVTVNGK